MDLAIPEDYREILNKAAEKEKESIPSSSEMISTKNKQFSLNGNQLGSSMDVVVVASKMEHAFYDRPYDPSNTSPPACFAIEDEEGNMVPHPSSPNKQSDECKNCPNNEFGSAATGSGKACKNSRRLALMAYSSDGLDSSEIALLKLAPTSLKNFSRYSKTVVTAYKRPTFSVVTNLKFEPSVQYSVIVPSLEQTIKNEEELKEILSKRDTAIQMISEPYDVSGYEEAPQTKKKSKMS